MSLGISVGAGAAIAGGAALLSGGGQAYAQTKMNRATRDYNYDMWLKQNTQDYDNWVKQNQYNENMWAQQKDYNAGLWDKQNQYNENLWHQQNAYDSPSMQMARFKEAGLNPNLIYGQQGNSGSIQTANLEPAEGPSSAQRHTPGAMAYNPRAPNFDLTNGIQAYTQFKNQAAQTNNLESQNKAIEAGVLLTAAQTENMIAQTKKTYQDTDFGKQQFSHNLNYLQKQVEKITQDIGQDYTRFHQQTSIYDENLKGLEKDNRMKDLTYKQLEYIQKLREQGFEVTDPWYIRMLDDERLEGMMKNLGKVGKYTLKSIF